MNKPFAFADLHCHPNLKTFGHSFDDCAPGEKCNVWYYEPPGIFAKMLNTLTGITRFSQSDFTTLSKGGAKVIFASLYPFEKGFFINSAGKGAVSAWLSDLITGIGYNRIRHLQEHTSYFDDLENEYQFLKRSLRENEIDNKLYRWELSENWQAVENILRKNNEIAVILSIEGAHVFNTGLEEFGRIAVEEEIIANVRKVKQWQHPPLFITFAHNFDNELCGHAHSLEPIKRFVDQSARLNEGFTPLGYTVLGELLSSENGRPVYIDIKHMSLASRKDYFAFLEREFPGTLPPTIVSHGAVNGLSFSRSQETWDNNIFYASDLNFFDEELECIGRGGGLFAIQFDARRIARPELVRKKIPDAWRRGNPQLSAHLIWRQIQHIAEVLDRAGLYGWETATIGSDYDGTIDPLPGVWTAEYFHTLYEPLMLEADNYLRHSNPLIMPENRKVNPQEIVEGFFIQNALKFLRRNF